MRKRLPDGIWPTMITPFYPDGRIDFASLESLVDWYIREGVDGLFAVCQSSEMFYLSRAEKFEIAKRVIDVTAGRVPVIVSGHTSDDIGEQIRELKELSSLSVEALVLVTNRLASEDDSDAICIKNLRSISSALPDELMLGFYECPYPYKRLLTKEVIEYCLTENRYSFLKDTSCDSRVMKERLDMLGGSGFKLYNANSATLSISLKYGASGYSGVMANYHPSLYKRLVNGQMRLQGSMDHLQNLLGPLSAIEDGMYPLSAKYHLKRLGIISSAYTRKHATDCLPEQHRLLVDQMGALLADYEKKL